MLVVGVMLDARAAHALDGQRAVTQYVQTHYDARSGMPHGLANSLAQTLDGYLWLGSEEGLARFDGTRFATFDHRKTPGIPGNAFTSLVVDREGVLWAGTRELGLVRFVDGEFRTWPDPAMTGRQIRSLAVSRSGELWVGTRDHGLVMLRGGQVVRTLGVADGLPSADIRSLLVDRENGLWIGTFQGLAHWRAGRLLRGPARLDGVAVHAVAQDPRGDLWCATSIGLVRVHGDEVEAIDLRSLGEVELQRLLFDHDGNLWIGTSNGAARRTSDGRLDALPRLSASVLALFEDSESNLWIASERGLDRVRDGDVVPFGAAEGMTDGAVFGVREDATGALWIASDSGLMRVAPGETRAAQLTDHGTVYAIYPDRAGDVWFGARDGGIGRWHGGHFAWLGRRSWERVRSIVETADGLWIGTNHGVFRLRGEQLDDAEVVLPGPITSAMLPDADGAVWLGTEGQGLLRWQRGKLAPVPEGGPPATSSVATLRRDADGILWVGTEGDGLWWLQGTRWSVATSKDGMFDDVVWRILDDDAGNVWMSSNRGIWRVRRQQLLDKAAGLRASVDSVIYSEADGMRDRECNGAIDPAGWRTRDGRLWFPTGRGLAVIDPARLRPAVAPTAVIERLGVDSQDQPVRAQVELAAGASRLELTYTAPALRSPERLRFRYKLDGFDRRWNEVGAQQAAQYTNLAPGSYTFTVEAGVDGGWGRAAVVTVVLPPLWHQTRWFLALEILAGALAIASLPLIRVRRLRAQARELDARVQEALREVKVLSGMLPICAWCKKIRDDRGYWNKIEAYLSVRTEAKFTHGICPDCDAKVAAEDEEPQSS